MIHRQLLGLFCPGISAFLAAYRVVAKYYAELYRVGVLIVALGDESLDAVMSGSIRELDSMRSKCTR